MTPQKDECRVFLESYREALMESRRMDDGLRRLWDQATHTTATMTGMPRGGGDSGILLAALSDSLGNTLRRRAEAEKLRLSIEEFIDKVDGDMSREILRLRYVELLGWKAIQIKLAMSGAEYEERHIFRLHGVALSEARKEWRKTHDDHQHREEP